MPYTPITSTSGMNTDNLDGNIPQGSVTFALNAVISSFDRSYISYSTEQSNQFCTNLPQDFKVIGKYNITELNKVILFLVNPTTNESEVGELNNCVYTSIINGDCLGFSIDYPIHQIVVKNTNCSTEVYWTDNLNNFRYLNLNDLPWVEIPDPNNDYKKIKLEGQLDCNKLLIQSKFSIPKSEIESVQDGGILREGTYQFVVAYSNELGETYSSFYNVTNPISIKEKDRATQDFNLPTDQSIRVKVEDLDTTGVFDYFTLVVIETINGISTPRRVGVYPIANESYSILYTGNNTTDIQLTPEQLFQQFQYYDLAEGVLTSDDRLILYGVKEKQRINYQPIWSKVKLFWQTHKMLYSESEGYHNPMNTLLYKGYMRDEVYPVEGAFILSNGKTTDLFPIPGRLANTQDLELVNNLDASAITSNPCDTPLSRERWKVYNTGRVTGSFNNTTTDCYTGPYQYGEFSYWESEEKYPNNSIIWGDLANQKIRHHKFPDELISPRFSVEGDKEYVYPIGIKIDIDSLRQAILDSDLSQEQKDEIVGFKILRGERTEGNMSIKAKGYMTNVGKYEYEDQTYYFANYPYNSLDIDPLYANSAVKNNSGFDFPKVRRPYENGQGKDQFTFHSPDTHFGRQSAIDQGYLKIEAIDYGSGKGHFVPIRRNAEYKFLTSDAVKASVALASGVAFDFGKNGRPSFNGSDVISVYSNAQSLFEKLIPYQNFGYSINSQATFNKSFPIPNEGFKVRGLQYGKYLRGGGIESIENGLPLNNYLRESSVYLKTNEKLLYATEYSPLIPKDESRFIATINNDIQITPEEFFNTLKNDLTIAAMTALILGIRAAANNIISDSENATAILSSMISIILDPYITGMSWSDLQQLANEEAKCTEVGVNYPPVNINFTPTNTAINTPNIVNPTRQNVEIYSDTGVLLNAELPNVSAPTFSQPNNIPVIYPNQNFTLVYSRDVLNLTKEQQTYVDSQTPSNNVQASWIAWVNFGMVQEQICGGKLLQAAYDAIVYGAQAYQVNGATVEKKTLSNFRYFDVNAYYASLKSYLPAQWGRISSYTLVDTGYYQKLEDEPKTIFGGDTFINKFTLRTQLSVYNTNTVNLESGADIALNEEGNLGHPMFYISTKPLSYNYQIDYDALNTAFQGIGVVNKNALYGSLAQAIGSAVIAVGLGITATGVGALAGVIVTAVGGVIYILGSIFRNIGNKITKAVITLYKDLFQQLIDTIGIKNINLDMATRTGIAHQGLIYQYVKGLPTFFVESQVNVDLRQATNDNEGNFYPRVGEGVPDDWLQEDRVPIINDNNYTYNRTFSKQNKETYLATGKFHLREDFDPNKKCTSEFPNRAIWTEKTNLNETLNNWLVFKPVSRFDFPKSYGKLTSLDSISNGAVLARFENKTQVYNGLSTINTSTFQAYLGNDTLFSTKPQDFSETDGGSLGSQHKFLLRTEHGAISIDAMRGQIYVYRGEQPQIISDMGMSRWFSENLPFKITQYFPQINTDNNFKDCGISGVYDQEYNRLIITKSDFIPINENIGYSANTGFNINGNPISLKDPKYFCDQSWTLSFSFLTNSWISFHSYIPNYYISYPNYFKTGLNNGIWDHNKDFKTYHTFYNKIESYVLEYPLVYESPQDNILQSFRDYCTATVYTTKDIHYEPSDIKYFNKAELYNRSQHSGTRNLIPKPAKDLSALRKYPKYNTDSIDILIDKRDSWISFNSFWDIIKDHNKPAFIPTCSFLVETDQDNLDYTKRPFKNYLLRSKDARIRLTLDDKNDFKLTSRLVLAQSTESNA